MAKAEEQKQKEYFTKLAQTPPVLPVISDHPLDRKDAFNDSFDLCLRLGPVFDIIRHTNTPTPTAIAIYGDWGTGKTSSMKWLEGLINQWNEKGKIRNKTKVRTVWFYPWKYHDKDDVWRGLISEVILKGVEIEGANIKRVTKAAKQFGLFLGKGFIHTLSAIKLKAGDAKTTGEAEFDLSCIKDIISEYDKNIHPEKAFLNEFEESFKGWLNETLGDDERMVIFIDDLDRCMPQVALGVLEALKLYLNIEKLIFVVGVDKDVIEPLVNKHYKDLGLDEYKSSNYLAKMFQTEVTVGPSEDQIISYLDDHLDNVEYFGDSYLANNEKSIFHSLINTLADRNPREVKRLINSAIMSGAGVEMLKKTGDAHHNYSFKQGMQIFFIRYILEKYYPNMSRLLGSKQGNTFFNEWSKFVCDNIKTDENFPRTITLLKEHLRELSKARDIRKGSHEQVSKGMREKRFLELLPDISMDYYNFIKKSEYADFLTLFEDDRLWCLMQIEFSTEIAEKTEKVESATVRQDDETIIRNTIARQLGKSPDNLTEKDYNSLQDFSLSRNSVSDISYLSNLTNLTYLYLSHNQISNLSSISNLINLTDLYLSSNQISDISSLSSLANLAKLYLTDNKISDISVLFNSTSLAELSLYGNQISDISALGKLTNLTDLSLSNNQISDISELNKLTNLTRLGLEGNQISDISALNKFTNLRKLHLYNNQISDISALGKLTNLTKLDLNHNKISDISALAKLTSLTELYLSDNQISDISPLDKLASLIRLNLENNKIDDLAPLKGLEKLEYLYITGCDKITDEQIDNLENALPDLEINR